MANGVAVLTPTGGGASLASDVFDRLGVALPTMDSIRPAMLEIFPDAEVLNPIDLTGFAVIDPAVGARIAELYTASHEVEAVLFQWHMQNEFIGLVQTADRCADGAMQGAWKDLHLQCRRRRAYRIRGPRSGRRRARC